MLTVQGRGFLLDGHPFFFLGDTAWLLFSRLHTDEIRRYLRTRLSQGFNVVFATLVHEPGYALKTGEKALCNDDFSHPDNMPGGYWDTVHNLCREAEAMGMTMALVPAWGDFYRGALADPDTAAGYARFLARIFGDLDRIIWVLGGDIRASQARPSFDAMAQVFMQETPRFLRTFHPFGRTGSVTWYAHSPLLDFHLFQSGHRDRTQRRLNAWDDNEVAEDEWFAEDNFRYVEQALRLDDKPVLDGEPSYEDIPHGLHDPSKPRWTAREVRRYAYWSVLSGSAGHVYGHNSVMQLWTGYGHGNFGVNGHWSGALLAEGASGMGILRRLMEAAGFQNGIPCPELFSEMTEDRRILGLMLPDGLCAYAFTGSAFVPDRSRLSFEPTFAAFLSPATGRLLLTDPAAPCLQADMPDPDAQDMVLLLGTDDFGRRILDSFSEGGCP